MERRNIGNESRTQTAPKGPERIHYFDTLRFLAAMMIFITHYINRYSPDTFYWFFNTPTSIFLGWISGKLGVAMLCVILGYFAYRKGLRSSENLGKMFFQRYFHFVITAAVFYLIAGAVHYQIFGSGFDALRTIAVEAFTLSYNHNVNFWCLRPLLFGSGVCYILGRTRAKTMEIVFVTVFLSVFMDIWTAGCVAGALIFLWNQNEKVTKTLESRIVRIVIFVIVFALVHQKGNEGFWIFALEILFCFCTLLIVMNSPGLLKVLNMKGWQPVSKHYFGIFIFHTMVYEMLGSWLLESVLGSMPFKIRFILVFLVCFAVTILISIPVNAIIVQCDRGIKKILGRVLKNEAEV